jgi:hypothetical protein
VLRFIAYRRDGPQQGENARRNPKKEDQAKKEAARAERDESFKMAHQKARSAIFAAARAGRWEQVKRGIWDGP